MKTQFAHWVLGRDYDAISAQHNLQFTTDCLHLNTTGGSIALQVSYVAEI